MRTKPWPLAIVIILGAGAVSAQAEVVRFKPVKGVQTYAARVPVLTLKPGDILETNTLWSDGFAGKGTAWPGELCCTLQHRTAARACFIH